MLGPVWLARRILASSLNPMVRGYASSAGLVMQEFGTPEKVLKFAEQAIPAADTLGDNEVIINILAVSFGNPSQSLTKFLAPLTKPFKLHCRPLLTQLISTQLRVNTPFILNFQLLLAMRVSVWFMLSAQR